MIDRQASGIVYRVSTPYTLNSDAVAIEAASGHVNVVDKYTFTITLPLPLAVGAVIELTIPATISIFADAARTDMTLKSASASLPLYALPDVTVIDPDAQKVRISNLVP